MKPAAILAAIALLTPALFAAELSAKYKDWGASPEAYFMTRADRQQWAAIKTDAEAEQFIKSFEAARKPGFTEEVAKRVEVADKYLSVGRTPGSRTLRGKVIILFGPPSGFQVSDRTKRGENEMGSDSAVSAGAGASAGPGGGGTGQSPSDVVSALNHSSMSGAEIRTFTITYSGDKLPKPRAASLTVGVDVDTSNGKETLIDQRQMPELDELFEAAAGSWLLKPNQPAS